MCIVFMCRDSDKDQRGLAKFIHKKDDFLGRVFYLLQVSNYEEGWTLHCLL